LSYFEVRVSERALRHSQRAFENRRLCIYGFGEVLTLMSVFSSFVVLLPGGFTTVVLVSFFSDGGFTTVVLLSFFSAGGLTVVVFCSHAANKPNIANR
jgi:hypothetical protein